MKIRFAALSDSQALRDIYAQYIDTPITFECALPSDAEFRERIAKISAFYPYLICESKGKAVGYAYAHRQMSREAYQWNAELSVYLNRHHTGCGLGRILYQTLMDLLYLQGIRNVYGLVTLPNAASERLHASLGFHRLEPLHHTGYKCGRWHDVAWFEKSIAPCDGPPKPVCSLQDVTHDRIRAVISDCLALLPPD